MNKTISLEVLLNTKLNLQKSLLAGSKQLREKLDNMETRLSENLKVNSFGVCQSASIDMDKIAYALGVIDRLIEIAEDGEL